MIKRRRNSRIWTVSSMDNNNSKRVIDACPSLFETEEGVELSTHASPVGMFGFECGDGWTEILVTLCQKIQDHLATLPSEVSKDIVAVQVKEKYGTLRFYLSSLDEVIDQYINDAETSSANTCENCGKPGKVRGRNWVYSACEEHTREEDLRTAPDVELL